MHQNPDPRSPAQAPGEESSWTAVFSQVARNSGIERNADGSISLLKAVGGWRGLIEATAPSFVFMVWFLFTRDLRAALIGSVVVAVLCCVARLVQRTPVLQALAGLGGAVLCAVVAGRSGEASDYFVIGFWTNSAYLAGLLLSIAVRWPVAGVVFGFVFGEEFRWRRAKLRYRTYVQATLLLAAIFTLRLAVQLPLYFAGPDYFAALGTARLLMGLPMYALFLWLTWLVVNSTPPVRMSPRDQVPAPAADVPEPAGKETPEDKERR